MELKQFIDPLIKWWWLLVAAALIAAISSLVVVIGQPNTYQAHATLMIGNFIANPNPNSNEYYVAQQLAASYADIANRETIQSKTQAALGLPFLPANSTKAVPNTSLIEITVNDTDPKRAQAVANEISTQLIKNSPSGIKPEDAARQKFVSDQLDRLQVQIKDTQTTIDTLQQQLGSLTSASQIADLQIQITAQQQKYTSLQANYASLLLTSQQGATNSLTIIEPAEIPGTPIGPNRVIIILMATAVGLVMASLAAYGMEALDDTVKSVQDINYILKTQILGYIGMYQNKEKSIYVVDEPRSPVSDAFRVLRTNLDFLGMQKSLKTLLISSPDVGDGKSTIAMNLAASIAQSNHHTVILIDADLRKPTLHTIMNDKNEEGLSDICLGSISIEEALRPFCGESKFIPSGTLPPNPVDLLGSTRMTQIIEELKPMANLIIFDCPPMFLADTVVLSGKVDGVLIVVSIGHTRKKALSRLFDQLEKTGGNLIGVVVNRMPVSETYYPNYYHYSK